MEIIEGLLPIGVLGWISFWVFKDAKARGMNATGWTVGVFLLLIIVLPAYFLSRKPKLEIEEEPIDTNEI
jgi:hypothetical protein